MYIIYVDFVLKNKITIKKLGLTFRKLSAKEKNFFNGTNFVSFKI